MATDLSAWIRIYFSTLHFQRFCACTGENLQSSSVLVSSLCWLSDFCNVRARFAYGVLLNRLDRPQTCCEAVDSIAFEHNRTLVQAPVWWRIQAYVTWEVRIVCSTCFFVHAEDVELQEHVARSFRRFETLEHTDFGGAPRLPWLPGCLLGICTREFSCYCKNACELPFMIRGALWD